MTGRQQGPMWPELYRFKPGAFEVSNVLDGAMERTAGGYRWVPASYQLNM